MTGSSRQSPRHPKPLAVVSSHPIQYQVPLFRYLAAHGVPVQVLFLDDQGLHRRFDPGFGIEFAWDIELTTGYAHSFLPNHGFGRREAFFGLTNPDLVRELSPKRHSAMLVHGWRSASMLLAIVTGRAKGLPILYRADTSEAADIKARLAGPFLRYFVSACLPVGSLNLEFYKSIGFPEQRLFMAPHAVDNARFQKAAESLSRSGSRAALNLPSTGLVVLFVGKLVRWKAPDLLLEAFRALGREDSHLVYVGDGTMRRELEVKAGDLAGRVHFLGFLNQERLPLAYRAADVLVLPSNTEPWGLVVNEAMNFGVPAVVSDRVGCAPDLVRPGITGEVFSAGSCGSLLAALRRLASDPRHLEEQGVAARAQISRWGYAECTAAIRAAIDAVDNSDRAS